MSGERRDHLPDSETPRAGGEKAGPSFELSCPLPHEDRERIVLAHGGGGLMMNRLIERVFLPAFDNAWIRSRHDGAVAPLGRERMAISTDSYVVRPMFFPGGDIGKLAVFGTTNDLAMCGARPLYLSVGLILEEGTPIDVVRRVVESMKDAAAKVGVDIVTGDTKVVDRGKGDQIFINTTGVGGLDHRPGDAPDICPSSVVAGDVVLISGDVGRHGIAVMASREGLSFETTIESDCAPLSNMVLSLLEAGMEIHCLRDCTRGGVASALVEIAQGSRCDIEIEESSLPVHEQVRGACEIFGLDPLYVANEGCMIAFLPESQAERALEIMRRDAAGVMACRLGRVLSKGRGDVSLRSLLGTIRTIDMLSGDQLPRIC